MKNKLTINTLARNNIKHRKKQYTLMIIGILLSMIFSSTAVLFASSMATSTSEYYKNNFGNCEAIFYDEDADDEFYEQAVKQNYLDDYGLAYILGRIYPEKDSEELSLNIGYLDEKAKELYSVSLLEGEYPTKTGEIALEKATLEQINPDLKIGDVFTVYMRGQNAETHLDGLEEKTFKLVGILRNKRMNILLQENLIPDFLPSAFVSDGSIALAGSKEAKVAYINISDYSEKDGDVDSTWYDYLINNGMRGEDRVDMQAYIFSYKNQFQYSNTYMAMILVAVFSIVLLLSSSVGIINAMNSNIADRKKQIGMLRTVGATKRQIRKIFSRESIIISLICAPVSLVVAFVAVKSMSGVFGEEFNFTLNIPVLILSGIFSVICVVLASVIPVYSASKVSPVQSIRNIEIMRKMKLKNIKSKKEFNVSSLLSKRNLTFYRRRQAIVSLFLIVTIVASCFGFSYLKAEAQYTYEYQNSRSDYQLIASNHVLGTYDNIKSDTSSGYSENLKQSLWDMPYTSSVSGKKECRGTLLVDELTDYFEVFNMQNYSPDADEEYKTKETARVKKACQTDQEVFPIEIISLEQSEVEALKSKLNGGKIDIERLNSGAEVILVAPDKVAYGVEKNSHGVYRSWLHNDGDISDKKEYTATAERTINVGDTFELNVLFTYDEFFEDVECLKNTVTVSSHIKTDEIPNIAPYAKLAFITTHEGMKKLCGDRIGYSVLSMALKDEYRENMTEELDNTIMNKLEIATLNMGSYNHIISSYGNQVENTVSFAVIFFALLSVMALLLAGSISIINNSLTARIRESKREMGTLRAVGATQKDLTISYIRQLLSMFGWGTGLGFGIFFVGYIVLKIVEKVKEMDMYLDLCIWPAVVATVILFVICSVNLYSKIKKETKNSIIENIREL